MPIEAVEVNVYKHGEIVGQETRYVAHCACRKYRSLQTESREKAERSHTTHALKQANKARPTSL